MKEKNRLAFSHFFSFNVLTVMGKNIEDRKGNNIRIKEDGFYIYNIKPITCLKRIIHD